MRRSGTRDRDLFADARVGFAGAVSVTVTVQKPFAVVVVQHRTLPILAAKFWADVRFVFANAGAGAPSRSCAPSAPNHSRSRAFLSRRPEAPRNVLTCARRHASTRAAPPQDSALSTFDIENEIFHNTPYDAQTPAYPSSSGGSRFDWRLRALSRARKPQEKEQQEFGSQPQRATKRVDPQHTTLQLGEPFHDEVAAYEERCVSLLLPCVRHSDCVACCDRFLPLLDAEVAEEETMLRDRLSKWSIVRLRAEGYCITDMSAYWLEERFYGNPVASFALGPGIELPENKFECVSSLLSCCYCNADLCADIMCSGGSQVLVTHLDPLQEQPVKGRVVARTSTHLRVSFQKLFNLDEGLWRYVPLLPPPFPLSHTHTYILCSVDLGQSNITFERMRTAISHMHQDPYLLERSESSPDRELILQGTHLRDVLLRAFSSSLPAHPHVPVQAPEDTEYVSHETLEHEGHMPGAHGGAFSEDMRIQSWARRYARVDPVRVEGDPVLNGLNATQVRAVAMMIGERISLVQGVRISLPSCLCDTHMRL